MRKLVVKIICILSVFLISTAIYGQEEERQKRQKRQKKEELGSKESRASLFELYTTLSRAYLDIKRLDKEIIVLQKQILKARRRAATEKLRLHSRIDVLLKDKQNLIREYEAKASNEYDIFAIVLKVQGSHKEIEPLLEFSVRPLKDLSIYAQIGMGYVVDTKRLELNYKIGLSYKLFGV